MKFLILNGPNLNLLGEREPEIYGHQTLVDVGKVVKEQADSLGVEVDFFQSNHEGVLIDVLHDGRKTYTGVVYNPGAHTHYSYALRDAVVAIGIPVVEVHLSDIATREDFRKISVIAPVCVAQVSGFGIESYCKGLQILIDREA